MSDSNLRHFLRPEASPVPYETLRKRHKTARRVLDSMIEALQAASESAAKKRPKGDELSIDMNRLSRIFFVSGEPGSGKTTLYLTLKAMLSSKSEYSKYREGYRGGGLGGLEEPAVRWLEPIDLEVAGDEGENLLAAVLVRLVRKLDESKSGFSKSCGDAIKKLEQLTADIGLAWDGNLQARASELDPDMFSMEVMRAERARLGVNERLREALDELAENDCCGCKSNTLFVLPVDDLYLNPNASLQLLRLLRMISVPRLFFLVMGDITTVEAIFLEKALADWTAVAGAEVFRARPARLDEALARARELRARFLRKLLPPGQRAVIQVMEWDEALGFKPEPRDDKEDKAATLNSLLEVDLDPPPESTTNKNAGKKMTLLKHLISPPREDKQSKEVKSSDKDKVASEKVTEDKRSKKEQEKKAREAYTALQILDATPREIMDLWAELNKLRHQDEPPDNSQKTDDTQCKSQKTDDAVAPLLLRVVKFVQLVIEEQNFLNEREQDSLRVVLPRRHYSPRDIQFDMNRLTLRPEQDPWIDEFDGSLCVRKHRLWRLTVNGLRKDRDAEPFANLLPPRPTAWLILLHDLAWEWNPDSVTVNLVERLCKELEKSLGLDREAGSQPIKDRVMENAVKRFLDLFERFVSQSNEDQIREDEASSQSKRDDGSGAKQEPCPSGDLRGWAFWRNGSTNEHFPMPEFRTFRDLDRFLFVWSSGLDEWLKVKKQAAEAQKEAEAADAQKLADGKQAEANKAQQDPNEAQKLADELRNRVGADERQQLIYLWGLAGSTVIDEQYKGFATRGEKWFEIDWENFLKDSDENHSSKIWRQRIGDFEKRVSTARNPSVGPTPQS